MKVGRQALGKLGRVSLLAGLMAGSFGLGTGYAPLVMAAESRDFRTFFEVYNKVRGEFLTPPGDETKLEYGAIRGMLETLDDPYTRFMEPKVFKAMQEERQGSFSGIGIQIGMRDKKLTVVAPIEETPAWKAGLKAGDHIVSVDGKSTKDMAIDEAVGLIRGQRGTPVKLVIVRGGSKPRTIAIVRDNIITKAVRSRTLPDNIGYIRLSTFMSESADREMREALQQLTSKRALILDLRGNPGGLLPNAVTIGRMFVDKGPIVQIVDREGHRDVLPTEGMDRRMGNKVLWDKRKPLVVLVDGGSASASEILAGALQDAGVGTLIGTTTFGKGLVQTVHPLEEGAGLTITTNKYLTAGGNDINKRGIVPDLLQEPARPGKKEAEPDPTDDKARDAKDAQLQKAMAFIRGRLGQGPVIRIPSRASVLEAAAKKKRNEQVAEAEAQTSVDLEATQRLEGKVTSLLEVGKAGEDQVTRLLTDLSGKVRGLTTDQLQRITSHKDFDIEVEGEANAGEGEVAIRRAETTAAYVRGYLQHMGLPFRAEDLKVRSREGSQGGVTVRIHLPLQGLIGK
ncbi:MAG: S41 family peptidase [Candidatus Sericytochromatia bacterium]|nr:S41 family peptidase [Candidatus Sericytochromatia bacterium]